MSAHTGNRGNNSIFVIDVQQIVDVQ